MELHSVDVAALSPLLIILATALGVLLLETFAERSAKIFSFYLSVAGMTAALVATLWAPGSVSPLLAPWLKFDSLAHTFTVFFLLIGIGTAFLASSFFQRFDASHGEYYFLLLSALFGLILIGQSADFLTLFLGIETLSISLYILCGYMKKWTFSHEAALKYFLMGSLAAAFLLYGIALIYGATGTTRLDALLGAYKSLSGSSQTLFLTGIALVTLAFAFEAAIVPFQVWAPDVYDGSPTPVTAFMAVGTKVGAFAAFARVFFDALPNFDPIWNEAVSFLVYPTLIYANYVAIRQTQLRRFFAYSGISHAGFLLIPLAAGGPEALSAMLFYLVVYAFATLGAFAVIAFLDYRKEGVMLEDLHGHFKRSPVMAGLLSLCLLTLAGIPPTAGFLAKFYIFKVAFQSGFYALVIVGLLTSILSAYYYLRIIGIMLTDAKEETPKAHLSWPATVVGAVAAIALLVLACYPAPLMQLLGSKV